MAKNYELMFFAVVVAVILAFFGVLFASLNSNNVNASGAASPTGSNNVITAPGVQVPSGAFVAPIVSGVQQVEVKAMDWGGYDKQEIVVKKGIPVKFSFSASQRAGCGKILVIPEYKISLISRSGETQTAEFTPEKTGTIIYQCTMAMFRGKIIVV